MVSRIGHRIKVGSRATVLLSLLLALQIGLATHPSLAEKAWPRDALHRKVRAELADFTDWIETNGVRGYVGEVGWPDDSKNDSQQWNALADDWFHAADEAGLWVMAWATGEWWGTSYKLAVYENRFKHDGVDSVNEQAEVLESHNARAGYRRGVTVNGGEFGAPIVPTTSHFSNESPGRYDTAYHYDRKGTFEFLARRGIDFVRIPFRWERIQPQLGGPLAADEVARIEAVAERARSAGIEVELDMHNYGAYYLSDGAKGVRRPIGSDEVTVRHFADAWRRLSLTFADNEAVVGYALMAEPYKLPTVDGTKPARLWEQASQEAVDAIRSTGDGKTLAISGYGWDAIQVFTKHHSDAWIDDPMDDFLYEVHHYWDSDYSGRYAKTYEQEVELAREQGW